MWSSHNLKPPSQNSEAFRLKPEWLSTFLARPSMNSQSESLNSH